MGVESAIAGGLVSGGLGLIGQSKTNAKASQLADRQQQFELEMANTQYQRGVEDLTKAGLNPMLAVAKPAGMASYTPPAFEAPISTASKAGITNFSALQSARQSEAAITNANSQSKLNDALTAKAAADTTSALATAEYTASNTAKNKAGSFTSSLIGTEASAKTSQFLNSAMDAATNKIDSLVTGIRANSAKALDMFNKPISSYMDYVGSKAKKYFGDDHPAQTYNSLPPPPPPPSYWQGKY